ncbi:MAG: hypothetical protein SXA11_05315 [Cyanobacteriota bacterium]|nr:hypothetical protein [Cyanobacteriota bacterium]
MTTNASLEERVAVVEAAIAELQKQVQLVNPQPTNWIEEVSGSFEDGPAFEEVLAYGRAIRQEKYDDEGNSFVY